MSRWSLEQILRPCIPALEGPDMADVGLIALTVLLFGLLALVVMGVERL